MVKAIIWDYDGTLVDTRHKNLAVTKEIMKHVAGFAARLPENWVTLRLLKIQSDPM